MRRSLLLPLPVLVLSIVSTLIGIAPARAVPAGAMSVWQAPVPGPIQVVHPFQDPPEPWAAGHRGVDLAAPAGAPIRAPSDGFVAFAGVVAGRGVVSLDHGLPASTLPASASMPGSGGDEAALRTTYEPVKAAVQQGDRVRRGEIIGTLEPGGTHCLDPCLHWGLRDLAAERDALASGGPYAGAPVYRDPMALLARARIRLLPRLGDPAVPFGQPNPGGPTSPAAPSPDAPVVDSATATPSAGAAKGGSPAVPSGSLPGGPAAIGLLVAGSGATVALGRRFRPPL